MSRTSGRDKYILQDYYGEVLTKKGWYYLLIAFFVYKKEVRKELSEKNKAKNVKVFVKIYEENKNTQRSKDIFSSIGTEQ